MTAATADASPELLRRTIPSTTTTGRVGRLWTIGTELSALAAMAVSMPLRSILLRPDEFDPHAPHPTPVVLVHGFLGDHHNFIVLRQFLVTRGVRNFTSFSYRPRLDLARLASRLRRTID